MRKTEVFQHNCTPSKNYQIYAITISDLLRHIPQRLHRPHRINFYTLHLYTKGNSTHLVDFNKIAIIPGRIVLVANGWTHSLDPEINYDGFALMFTEEFFNRTGFHRRFLQNTPLFNNPLHPVYFDAGDRSNGTGD